MSAAMSGESRDRRERASPTMPNCRSTADLSNSSARYCSKRLPRVKRAMRSAAVWTSVRYFRASSRIEQDLFLLHALPEMGVAQAGGRDDVHRLGEQLLQLLPQGEVGCRVLGRRALAEI